ncbi:MAG: hypothetical protein GXX96_35685 [Planctomycetaceae bacterium]|nr:hypothetical protein [Planctomycetaceae bacterium]
MLTLLLADRSNWNESKARDAFGVIAEDGEVVRHWVMSGSKLDSGCLVVPHEDCSLFWQLGNYRVSTRSGPMLYLVPVDMPVERTPKTPP